MNCVANTLTMFDWFLAKLEKVLCSWTCCDHKVWRRLVTPYAVAAEDPFFKSPNLFTLFCTVITKRIKIPII